MGNAILHGCLLRTRSSNFRRLRLVVDTYWELVETSGFIADHVTVNILLKARLRLRTEVDGARVRQLFDALVHMGYPTGEDGGQPKSPPFGTKVMGEILVGSLVLPRVDAPLSFRRHIEPIYKTFVKAFYLRGDVAAGRKVIGILKTLEARDWKE